MCSCLPIDATTVNPILFALQMVLRKLLPKPLSQMTGPSAHDSPELTTANINDEDDQESMIDLLMSFCALAAAWMCSDTSERLCCPRSSSARALQGALAPELL